MVTSAHASTSKQAAAPLLPKRPRDVNARAFQIVAEHRSGTHDVLLAFKNRARGERRGTVWYGGGRASYDGANVGFRVRQEKFEMQGFYTYSEAEGNVLAGADEFRLTDAGAQADVGGTRNRRDQSINPLDPQCGRCFGPLYTDARHRITFGGLYHGPWGLNLSGMFRYHSALPYLEHANADLNGDGSIIDLRPGVSGVNTGRGDEFKQLDVRLSREFHFTGDFSLELIAEMFKVFNSKNPARPNRFGVPAAFAGDPLQGEQQLAQFGARIRF